MGDLVNLNKHRKRTTQDRSEKQAEINRARFGRTKAQRKTNEQHADRASKMLDQHRIAPEDS